MLHRIQEVYWSKTQKCRNSSKRVTATCSVGEKRVVVESAIISLLERHFHVRKMTSARRSVTRADNPSLKFK